MGRKKKNPYKLGDRFNKAAKDDGYRARSVYKLTEVQRRFRVLAQNQRVVDLGCAPGSWARYAQQQVGKGGLVLGVDLQHVDCLPGVKLMIADVFDITPAELLAELGAPAHVLLSDMAPSTMGDRFGDHVRQVEIARRALDLAVDVLLPGGHFVCKVFEGEEAPSFVADVRKHFTKVKRLRPEAVRRESVEFFVVGLEKRAP